MFVAVVYPNKYKPGEWGKREYTYRCNIPDIKVGDIVIAPTQYGDNEAKIARVDVPGYTIPDNVLPYLRDINRRKEDPANAE